MLIVKWNPSLKKIIEFFIWTLTRKLPYIGNPVKYNNFYIKKKKNNKTIRTPNHNPNFWLVYLPQEFFCEEHLSLEKICYQEDEKGKINTGIFPNPKEHLEKNFLPCKNCYVENISYFPLKKKKILLGQTEGEAEPQGKE